MEGQRTLRDRSQLHLVPVLDRNVRKGRKPVEEEEDDLHDVAVLQLKRDVSAFDNGNERDRGFGTPPSVAQRKLRHSPFGA